MAQCVVCRHWAGVGKKKHDYDCATFIAPPAPVTEQDILVAKLAPVIRSAAIRGGVAGAFTGVGLLIALGILFAIIRALTS